jgi:hypothetical protein
MNKLAIASIVLVVLAGVTFFQLNARRSEDIEQPKVTVALPKLKTDQIDELELTAPDKPKARLVKKDGAWRLVEPVDAKADENAVNAAVTKLTELDMAGVAATLAKNHEKLEVDEKNGTRVIAKGGGDVLFDAYIGAYKSGSTMVRLNGQEPVAAVRGSIRFAFTKDTKDWRDRKINDIPPATVQQITFTNGASKLTFKRENDAFVQVLGKGEKKIDPLDANKVKGVVGTSANLSATDFAAAGEAPDQLGFTEASPSVVLDVKDEAGKESQVVYRIGGKKEDSYYVRKDGDDVTYVVSQWIGERLLSTRDSLIKKEPEGAKGSPGNPIQVEPKMMAPGAAGLPPGMTMQQLQQMAGQQQGHP